ncbi:hypothetical protein LEN26_017048 [Aphanomyces euteiches]|nr:hypothetical protein LEN26_017048 [Aphanomyces euteiches]
MRTFAPLALATTAAAILVSSPQSPDSPLVLTPKVPATDSINDLRVLADNRRGFVVAKSVVRLRNSNGASSSRGLDRRDSQKDRPVKKTERMPSKKNAPERQTSKLKRVPSRKMGPHEIEGRRIGGNIGQTVGGAFGGAAAGAAGNALGTAVGGPVGATFGTIAGSTMGTAAGAACGEAVGSWIGGQIGRKRDEAEARRQAQACRNLLSVKYAAILPKSS